MNRTDKRRAKRRSKSSVERLPSSVRQRIEQLLKADQHTLDELIDTLRSEFPSQPTPSRSALGRYSQRFEEVGRKMRESREVAKVWADRLGNEPQGDVGKLVMELLRTMAFDATMELQEPGEDGKVQLDPKAINTLALAMQRLEAAGKCNIEREQTMRAAALKEAADTAAKIAKKGGLSVGAVDEIRRQILGIPS